MDSKHRCILKDKYDILTKNVCLDDIMPFLKEHKIFNEYMWKDISSTSDIFDALPFRGPKAFRHIIGILRKAKYEKEADLLEKPIVKKTLDTELFYKMSSKPLGYCLIINNVEFDSPKQKEGTEAKEKPLCDRKGSDIDAESLRNFFENIGFNVIDKRNKKAREMHACLKEFSERNFMDVDSMIVIILSHGGQLENKDFIYGTDGDYIYKTQIFAYFSNKNCEQLQNKPKMFFFIACRGTGTDYGVLRSFPNESADSTEIILPSFSDIFVVHSSLPDQVSIRDHENGSYFCEALIIVLKEHYQTYDLETMIKLVNEKLKNKVSEVYRIIQVAHIENLGGTKKIMLCQSTS